MNNKCKNCGNELAPNTMICPACGVSVESNNLNYQQPVNPIPINNEQVQQPIEATPINNEQIQQSIGATPINNEQVQQPIEAAPINNEQIQQPIGATPINNEQVQQPIENNNQQEISHQNGYINQAQPMPAANVEPQNPNYNNTPEPNKNTESNKNISLILGIIGILTIFAKSDTLEIVSYISMFIGLVLCIVGLVFGKKYKKKTGKKCAGYILSIIGVVLKSIAIVLGIALLILWGGIKKDITSKLTNTETPSISSNKKQDMPSNSVPSITTTEPQNNTKSVGSPEVGYIQVPNNWAKFYDSYTPNAIKYSTLDKKYIVYIDALGTLTSEDFISRIDLVKQLIENNNNVLVSKSQVMIDTYNAYKLEYYVSNVWVDEYYFLDEYEIFHIITIEGPNKYDDSFKIPTTYSKTSQ